VRWRLRDLIGNLAHYTAKNAKSPGRLGLRRSWHYWTREAEVRRALAQVGQEDIDGLFALDAPEVSAHVRLIIAWENERGSPHFEMRPLASTSPD